MPWCLAAGWRSVVGESEVAVTAELDDANVAQPVEPVKTKIEVAETSETSETSEHSDFLGELLALTKSVDTLQGEERQKKALEVEGKLQDMEEKLRQTDGVDAKHLNLISLVRKALQKDGVGEEMDMSDEALQGFGIVPYGSPQYWENAFQQKKYGDLFDWYLGFHSDTEQNKTFGSLLMDHIKPEHNILHGGCGNSNITFFLYDKGYRNITNIDVSASAIEHMRESYISQYPMKWVHMDATNMEFEEDTFDVVFEKGLFDAAGSGDNALLFLEEAKRVLKPSGFLISVAFGKTEDYLADLTCERFLLGKSRPRHGDKEASRTFTLLVCKMQ